MPSSATNAAAAVFSKVNQTCTDPTTINLDLDLDTHGSHDSTNVRRLGADCSHRA